MTSPQEETAAAPCIPNINLEQRRRRLAFGLVALAFSLAVLFVLLLLDVSRWWRLTLLPLFYGAMIGVFQWREKT
jgi:hypothetical protein